MDWEEDDDEFDTLSRLVFDVVHRGSIPGTYPRCRSLRLPRTFHGDELCWAWRAYYEYEQRPPGTAAPEGS